MGKLGPVVAQDNLALPCRASTGAWLSTLSWSLPDSCLFFQQECCGTSGPIDWVNFTSTFREATPEVVFPWPPLCCRRTGNFIPLSEEGCRLGHVDYLFTKVCPLPAASSVCGFSGPLCFFWVFLSPTVSLLSPSLLSSFLFLLLLSGSLNSCSICPPSLYKSVGCTQGLSHSDLAPATFLKLSGNTSNNNNINSKIPITTHIY